MVHSRKKTKKFAPKMSYLLGMLTAPIIFAWSLSGKSFIIGSSTALFDANLSMETNIFAWIIGGILTGFGVNYAGGCTSGHGISGVARLQLRSIVSLMVLTSCAIAMATFKYYVPFFNHDISYGAFTLIW